jgi:hypothetical protein
MKAAFGTNPRRATPVIVVSLFVGTGDSFVVVQMNKGHLMQDIISMLQALHRPHLMMRAARIGAENYSRATHLPRLLGYGVLPRHGAALIKLMEIEAELNTQRKATDASYSLFRHIDVLIAMVAEARVLRATQRSDAPD